MPAGTLLLREQGGTGRWSPGRALNPGVRGTWLPPSSHMSHPAQGGGDVGSHVRQYATFVGGTK